MKKILFLSLFVFLFLAGCKKVDSEPAESTSGKLSCVAEGIQINSKAWATNTPASASHNYSDELIIHALTPKKEDFVLFYVKTAGEDDSKYKLLLVEYVPIPLGPNNPIVTYYDIVGTLKKTTKGWSGTFSGKVHASTSTKGPEGIVTNGKFTDVEE